MLASFEKTADHLFDAAYFGQKDSVCGRFGASSSLARGLCGFLLLLWAELGAPWGLPASCFQPILHPHVQGCLGPPVTEPLVGSAR